MNISKKSFYSVTGISRGTLESNTGITEDILMKFINEVPNINIEWLITRVGDMVKNDTSFSKLEENEVKYESKNDNILKELTNLKIEINRINKILIKNGLI